MTVGQFQKKKKEIEGLKKRNGFMTKHVNSLKKL
jgi:hypothetical protein